MNPVKLTQFLQTLNPRQSDAVLHYENPLLILAGAGSGKTRVIIGKIAYLIGSQGIDPSSILAVTFTNKAAEEMRTRAADLDPRAQGVLIKTFHSFGAWLLRRNATHLGLSSQFTIYDDEDQLTLLGTLYPESNKNQLRGVARQISRAKDYGLSPEHNLDQITGDPEFRIAYRRYEKRLREIGNVDFGDLIGRTTELLTQEPSIRQRIHDRFRVILVDEYQDSNLAQDQMLRALTGPQTYICVVGDDDQSIYRFRGAEVANILEFATRYPGTDTIRLEQNYRSTGSILALAGAVVSKNEGRLGKTLWTENPEGVLPQVYYLEDGEEEAASITQLLKEDLAKGRPLEDTAILYRTNAQSRLFETSFLHGAIPYRIIGTLRFYEREEVKDALAFLKFLANQKDEVAFRRIINKPSRGLGNAALSRILDRITSARGNLALSIEYALSDLSSKARKGAEAFLYLVRDLEHPPAAGDTLTAWLSVVIEKSGLGEYHQEQDEVAGTQKMQNLEELLNAASLYPNSLDGLTEFLEAVELDSSREETAEGVDAVTLITIHNTKGLEFTRVLCTGMEEGLFPRNNDDPLELEEERRLFYVAATRARKELYFYSCARRRIHGRYVDSAPSRFLDEIPPELCTRHFGYEPTGFSKKPSRPYEQNWGRPIPQPRDKASTNTVQSQYKLGDRVYSDEYGTGEVRKVTFNGNEEVVLVQFATGKTATFLPRYTPLEKVAE